MAYWFYFIYILAIIGFLGFYFTLIDDYSEKSFKMKKLATTAVIGANFAFWLFGMVSMGEAGHLRIAESEQAEAYSICLKHSDTLWKHDFCCYYNSLWKTFCSESCPCKVTD